MAHHRSRREPAERRHRRVGQPRRHLLRGRFGRHLEERDRGVTWEPVFDDQEAASISALAVSPSHPGHVWAGTGETFIIRPALAMGNGIYRSTDGGRSFEHRGLEATGRIARILVHPEDPDLVYACALGHSYAPQPERGVYRTRDGGAWELVLHVDENTGCSDSPWTSATPTGCSRGCGNSRSTPAGFKAAARAAGLPLP